MLDYEELLFESNSQLMVLHRLQNNLDNKISKKKQAKALAQKKLEDAKKDLEKARKKKRIDEKFTDEVTRKYSEVMKHKSVLEKIEKALDFLLSKRRKVEKKAVKISKTQKVLRRTARAVTVTLLITAARKIYIDYVDENGKKCKKRVGLDKIQCMKEVRIKALEKRVKELDKSKSKCSETRFPKICKQNIQDETKRLKDTIKEVKKSLKDI